MLHPSWTISASSHWSVKNICSVFSIWIGRICIFQTELNTFCSLILAILGSVECVQPSVIFLAGDSSVHWDPFLSIDEAESLKGAISCTQGDKVTGGWEEWHTSYRRRKLAGAWLKLRNVLLAELRAQCKHYMANTVAAEASLRYVWHIGFQSRRKTMVPEKSLTLLSKIFLAFFSSCFALTLASR